MRNKSQRKGKSIAATNKNFGNFLKNMQQSMNKNTDEQNKLTVDSLNTFGAMIERIEIKVNNTANDAESQTKKGKTES